MLSIFIFIAVLLINIIQITSQIPCDNEYGQYCPEATGFDVGICLKNKGLESLNEECIKFIQMHDTCKDDINTYCSGKEYTGDALVCLSEWTKPSDLSEKCLNAIPKKEIKERKLSAEEKMKADKRRKARKAAEKMAREL